jgi:uncharacterized protein with HEPN domain
MNRRTRERLEDIVRAINNIRGYVGGSLESPRIDEQVVLDAVLYNLIVVGEAAKNVEAEVRERVEQVPWREYAGLRDVLAHQYSRVQKQIVEDTVRRDLPRLEEAVTALLRGAG